MNRLLYYTYIYPSLFRLLFICYFIVISVLSLKTGADENSRFDLNSYGILFLDKISHAIAYALFAIQGFIQLKNRKQYKALCIAITLYGTLLEFIQHSFIPQRMGSIEDALANMLGVIIGYTICVYWIANNDKVN